MKLKQTSPPHISYSYNSRTYMVNVILALLVLYAMAYFYYGVRALLLGLVSVAGTVIAEWICLSIFSRRPSIHDISSIVTGLIIPLLLPATVPFYIPIIAGIFSIVIVKQPFGGTGNNIFNPAAAGFAFIVTCFSSEILFKYPLPNPAQHLPITITSDITLVTSAAFSLGTQGIPAYSPVQMVLGNIPGPMGATNLLVLSSCMLFLMLRRTISVKLPAAFFATVAIISYFHVRIPVRPLLSVFYELASGFILFGAIFLLNDPVTSPKRSMSRIIYGVIFGAMVMLFRYYGKTEGSFMFVTLLMNALVWNLDMGLEKLVSIRRRKKFENISNT